MEKLGNEEGGIRGNEVRGNRDSERKYGVRK